MKPIENRRSATENIAKEFGKDYGRQSPCARACAKFYRVADKCRFLQSIADLVRVLRRNGYGVRSRKSSIRKGSTVGSLRAQLGKLGAGSYLVRVEGHVLVMLGDGQTVVDTDPRKSDRRRVLNIFKIQNARGM